MAGTVSIVKHDSVAGIGRLVITATADASDGSYPDTALPPISGRLLALITNPGATGPTALYDITLVDGDGIDRLQGVGADRSATASEEAAIVYSGTSLHPPVQFGETLTLNIDNNSVNSAAIVATLLFEGVVG